MKALSLFLVLSLCLFSCAASAAPLRVISLYPGHTDNVVALGGEALLVGISENDAPDLLPELPRFSLKAGPESLLALRPDVVLIRGLVQRMNPNLNEVLTRAGVRVEILDTPSWEEFPDYLRTLAEVLKLDPEAGVKRFQDIQKSIRDSAEEAQAEGKTPPAVFVEATAKELHTCSPDSWAAHMLALAGGVNAASDAEPLRKGSPLAPWGLERVLELLSKGLDVYIIQRGAMNATTPDAARARPWAAALEKTRLAEMPERELSRPSLLGMERGGKILVEIFYGK